MINMLAELELGIPRWVTKGACGILVVATTRNRCHKPVLGVRHGRAQLAPSARADTLKDGRSILKQVQDRLLRPYGMLCYDFFKTYTGISAGQPRRKGNQCPAPAVVYSCEPLRW